MEQKMDLLVSFDTTGSMYPVLSQVRMEVEQFVRQMFAEFKDLRLGIIVHGDYCDKDNPYTILVRDFTRNENELCNFVRNAEKTFGGDADECYELVLNTAYKQLNWRPDAIKLMIMIGDAAPHGVSYRDNVDNLDWKDEAHILGYKGVKVFAVHALSYYRQSSKFFYKHVAQETGGVYLTLDQFNEVIDLIKATAYQQGGVEKLNEFITIIKDSGKMTHSMNVNFRRLQGEEVEDEECRHYKSYFDKVRHSTRGRTTDEDVRLKDIGDLVPVLPGRFQIMTVDENCDIKGFVTKNGIEFKKGRGFYELSKAETVQQYKEVIMQDRETGEMFTGAQVREKLGLQPQSEKGGVNERLHKADAEMFRVFVQSTSVNRKLIAGTTFLYEISDLEDVGTKVDEIKSDTKVKKSTSSVKKESTSDKKVSTSTKKKSTDKKEDKSKVDGVTFTELKGMEAVASSIVTTDEKIPRKTKAEKLAEESAKKKATERKEKVAYEKKVNESTERINKFMENVSDGLTRYSKSTNQKNTRYLVNNLSKLRAEIDKFMEIIDK